jgi:hypothetical protein
LAQPIYHRQHPLPDDQYQIRWLQLVHEYLRAICELFGLLNRLPAKA